MRNIFALHCGNLSVETNMPCDCTQIEILYTCIRYSLLPCSLAEGSLAAALIYKACDTSYSIEKNERIEANDEYKDNLYWSSC